MANQLLKRIEEQIETADGANIINITLSAKEKKHVQEVRQRLEDGYHYECLVRSFNDWQKGDYTVLSVHLDGATRLVLADSGPTIKGGMIGS